MSKETRAYAEPDRKLDQTIIIDGEIRIRVLGIRNNQVRLGIEAPDRYTIVRSELIEEALRPQLDTSAPRSWRSDRRHDP